MGERPQFRWGGGDKFHLTEPHSRWWSEQAKMVELLGVSYSNGLRYKGGAFPWCGLTKPTGIAHLSLAIACLLLFLLVTFIGPFVLGILSVVFFIMTIVFLVTGILIFVLSSAKGT